ncbi:DUF1643 domain-containing protein [Pseudoxanthomonas sp. NC8]|nr:DUF1643 domain-containing protein [Pseudoxanthomonas sp. NC8]
MSCRTRRYRWHADHSTKKICRLLPLQKLPLPAGAALGGGPLAGFVCHNPSLAADVTGDYTVSRLRGMAIRWGYGGSFWPTGLPAGNPRGWATLADMASPVGPRNWRHMRGGRRGRSSTASA